MENFHLLDVFEGITIARIKLRKRVEVIDKCHSKVYELLDWSVENLSELFEDAFTPEEICSQLRAHFSEAEYLIDIIQRATNKLKEFITDDHPELRPSAIDEVSNLKVKYEVIRKELCLYLELINIRYKMFIIAGL
ncbi:hypothetical protein TNCT_340931 [Trichonephila clavata]|uniref:Uncharacterized protein n=1 Tax=Trichonephila clavata TaxID=2740835 RepID=A0A8X6HSX2_TRICU|nr:hypothetical protein TNCT_340931 [Trichonephila clavata]